MLLALAVVCLYGLATKVAPGWLAEDEIYARLREPYGYWNAVGVTAAMGDPALPVARHPRRARRCATRSPTRCSALLIVTMLLSFSRGSIIAALVGVALWLALVPLRLRTLAVLLPVGRRRGAGDRLGLQPERAHRRPRRARRPRGRRHRVRADPARDGRCCCSAPASLIERRARAAAARRSATRRTARQARARIARGGAADRAGRRSRSATAASAARSPTAGTTSRSEQKTPQNDPGRLIETGNVRTIYWARAIDVWREHELAGAGAGSFAQAQLRFRDEPAQGRHAHGYVHQTLADLGLIGLGREPRWRSSAWLLAAARTLASAPRRCRRPGPRSAPACWRSRWWRSCSACTRRSTGPGSCPRSRSRACSAPAGSPGRGPLAAHVAAATRRRRRRHVRPRCRAGARCAAAARLRPAVVALAVARPRSPSRSRGARTARATRRSRCSSKGDFAGARAAAERAQRHQPAVGRAVLRARRDRGRRRQPAGGRAARSRTRCGSSPPARRRGGGSASTTRSTSTTRRGRCRCCGRALPRPGLGAEPQRLPRGAARPHRGRGRARAAERAKRAAKRARRAAPP